MPAWFALIVQVPMALSVSVVPLTVQIVVVADVNVTARPEVAVALSTAGDWSMRSGGSAANVIVCAFLAMATCRSTLGAGA